MVFSVHVEVFYIHYVMVSDLGTIVGKILPTPGVKYMVQLFVYFRFIFLTSKSSIYVDFILAHGGGH